MSSLTRNSGTRWLRHFARQSAAWLVEYPDDEFYYCVLITTGEALPPSLCAWSYQKLESMAGDDPEASYELKWSYADSPFYCYAEDEFEAVRRLCSARPAMDYSVPTQWNHEYGVRLSSMETAMHRVDLEGLFGTGARRLGIMINAEVMPSECRQRRACATAEPARGAGELAG